MSKRVVVDCVAEAVVPQHYDRFRNRRLPSRARADAGACRGARHAARIHGEARQRRCQAALHVRKLSSKRDVVLTRRRLHRHFCNLGLCLRYEQRRAGCGTRSLPISNAVSEQGGARGIGGTPVIDLATGPAPRIANRSNATAAASLRSSMSPSGSSHQTVTTAMPAPCKARGRGAAWPQTRMARSMSGPAAPDRIRPMAATATLTPSGGLARLCGLVQPKRSAKAAQDKRCRSRLRRRHGDSRHRPPRRGG